MHIRRGTPRDAPAVAAIQVRGWHEAYKVIMPRDRLAAMNTAVRVPIWEKLLADGVTLVGETTDGIAGFCSLGAVRDDDLDSSKVGEIFGLYVAPDLWRGGIGQSLCAAGLSWLEEQGFEAASLWVLEANTIGRGFYEKLGFARDGKAKPYLTGAKEMIELRYMISLSHPFYGPSTSGSGR